MKSVTLRWQLCAVASLLLIVSAFMFSGCDEANNPDTGPYHLAAQYTFPASPVDLVAEGDYVSVADGAYGTVVLNVHDLSHITQVSRDSVTFTSTALSTAIDTTHKYVVTSTDTDPNDPSRLWNYATNTRVVGLGFSGPLLRTMMLASADTISLWAMDLNDGFVAYRYTRTSDTSAFTQDQDFTWQPYNIPNRPLGRYYVRNFDRRQSDGAFALALDEAGLHFENAISGFLGDAVVPGTAYGCAWYGDRYLVVAGRVSVSMVDCQDLRHAHTIATLTFPPADQFEKVAIDGSYAWCLDTFRGIYLLDISDPTNMKYVQFISAPKGTGICADNGRVYVTTEEQGLLVFTR